LKARLHALDLSPEGALYAVIGLLAEGGVAPGRPMV